MFERIPYYFILIYEKIFASDLFCFWFASCAEIGAGIFIRRRSVSAPRKTIPDYKRRDASGQDSQRVLATPDPNGKSNGMQYH